MGDKFLKNFYFPYKGRAGNRFGCPIATSNDKLCYKMNDLVMRSPMDSLE